MSRTNLHLCNRQRRAFLDAVIMGDLEAVRTLLDKGAFVEARDSEHDETALMLALQFERNEIVELLLKRGADVHAKQNDGKVPVIYAQAALLPALVAAGADINARDNDGVTALMWAFQREDTEKVRWLLEHGADVHAEDDEGETALDYAERLGLTSLVSLLRAVATANKKAHELGVGVAQSLVTISQETRDGNAAWRVNYGVKDYINRRGGDLTIEVSAEDASVKRVLRGQ